LKALLTKNFILQKRNWCGSMCEILLPLVFLLLFSTLKSVFKAESYEK